MKTLLWLDDVRNPFDKDFTPYVALYNPFLNQEHKIVWVKDAFEFCDYIKTNGLPDAISFDHDLAPEHYDSFIDPMDYKEPTGYDCCKALVMWCETYKEKLPLCIYHTAKTSGKINMESYIENAKKHLDL